MYVFVEYSYPIIRDILMADPNLTIKEIAIRSQFSENHIDRLLNDTHVDKFMRYLDGRAYRYQHI